MHSDTSKSIVVHVFALADITNMLDELNVAAGQFEGLGGHLDTGQVSLRQWLTSHTRLGRNAAG